MTQPLTRATRWPRPLALACILCAGGVLQAQTPGVTFLTWPDRPGSGYANGVSADGSVVVGYGMYGAFSWRQSGDLAALPGGGSGDARAVSGDGLVVVGSIGDHAVRWTQGGKAVEDLGSTFDGGWSYATATNADGSVVVGAADGKTEKYCTAFRWTQATGGVDLGTLGGYQSRANGVSGDGSVVVGESDTSGELRHAFRWTTDTREMRDLGTLDKNGNGNSCANGISSNGLVVVGQSDLAESYFHAVRWVGNTIEDLHDPKSGLLSSANAANADGSVIVGWSGYPSYDAISLESKMAQSMPKIPNQAFRWTQASGMQSVEDWVVASGGRPLAAGNYLDQAYGVSADGSVVVGSGYLNGDEQPFVARGNGVPGSGVLGLSDFHGSLTQPTMAGTTLHERLRSGVMTDLQNNAPQQGRFAFSSMAVYEKYTKSEAEGHGLAGTVKLVYGITDAFRAGFSYIRGEEAIDLGNSGELKNGVDIFGGLVSLGQYTGEGPRARCSFAYGDGHSDITRRYLTGSGGDQSTGRMGVHQQGATLEGGYGFRLSPRTLVTPSLSFEWLQTKLGGYTETGGSFPARFDARTLVDSYARGGLKLQREFGVASNMTLEGNYVARLSSGRNPVSGTLLGLFAFSSSVEHSQSWAELRVGIDHVPVSVSKNLHLLLRYEANLGQRFDVPAHRVEAGFAYYF